MAIRRHLLDPWRDAFVLRARMLDVPGARIGDALAEIDAHCAETGESPAEAFGDAAEYASALAAAGAGNAEACAGAAARPQRIGQYAWIGLTSYGAMMLLTVGLIALVRGESAATLDAGLLAGWLATAAVGPALSTTLRVRGRTGRVAVGAAWLAAWLLVVLWSRPVVNLPTPVLLGAGAVLLVVALWPFADGRFLADRIVDPRTGRDPLPAVTGRLVALMLAGTLGCVIAFAVVVGLLSR